MRTALGTVVAAILCAGLYSAWSQTDDAAEEVQKGHRLAVAVCAICHVAADDQETHPLLQPPAPPFKEIAQRKDLDGATLEKFLTTTHRDLVTQKGMPNLNLADFQAKQVAAYLLSLRGH